MKPKYYSPRLERSLISPLYHAAKAEGVPMTKLASNWVAEKLATYRTDKESLQHSPKKEVR